MYEGVPKIFGDAGQTDRQTDRQIDRSRSPMHVERDKNQQKTNEKKSAQRDANTARKEEPKIFAPPQTPFPGRRTAKI